MWELECLLNQWQAGKADWQGLLSCSSCKAQEELQGVGLGQSSPRSLAAAMGMDGGALSHPGAPFLVAEPKRVAVPEAAAWCWEPCEEGGSGGFRFITVCKVSKMVCWARSAQIIHRYLRSLKVGLPFGSDCDCSLSICSLFHCCFLMSYLI